MFQHVESEIIFSGEPLQNKVELLFGGSCTITVMRCNDEENGYC